MSSELSQRKRNALPESFSQECPSCGEPFDAGSSGVMYPSENTVDAVAWVRVCFGPIPDDWFDVPNTQANLPFCYVHKDEHVEV